MTNAFALDTSCVIPLLLSWHEFHLRTKQTFDARRTKRERLVIPVHVLLESYSVLTRMPGRVTPEIARRMLEGSFFQTADIAGLAEGTAWSSIRDLSPRDMGGSNIYDAVIARAALEAGASVLLTWNLKHFIRVAPSELEIRQP